jgi:hypothetical protein
LFLPGEEIRLIAGESINKWKTWLAL